MVSYLLRFSRRARQILLVISDGILLPLALWAAFSLRLGEAVPGQMVDWYWAFILVPMISLPIFYYLGLYKTVVRFMGYEALLKVFIASSLFLLLWGAAVLMLADQFFPRSVIIIYWMAVLTVVGGTRVVARQMIIINQTEDDGGPTRRVAIFGAGSAGVQLLSATRTDSSISIEAFIDENSEFSGDDVAGVPVYDSVDINLLHNRKKIGEVWIALPSADPETHGRVLDLLESYPFQVKTLPSLNELIDRDISLEDIRDITIDDLLGRDVVAPDTAILGHSIKDKSVLITGAGGSIGSELARQACRLSPSVLVLLDHSEFNLYSIEKELEEMKSVVGATIPIVTLLGTVQNRQFLDYVVRQHRVHTIFHAAAYKHVPLVEHNPFEAVVNNVIGTRNIADSAQRFGVERVVLISTDKAVHPTNVMGATKRVAEMVLQAKSSMDIDTIFCMVRFGNVLGSSGSVVPLFQKQIKNGGPVTITHPRITRYFMTIPEAVQLVIQAGSMAKGGDLFVLDMGDPVKILDLATKMIHLSGFMVGNGKDGQREIDIVYSGLRPGEKLYEELLIGDNVSSTNHPKIMVAMEDHVAWDQLVIQLDRLEQCVQKRDYEELKNILQDLVVGYVPSEHL